MSTYHGNCTYCGQEIRGSVAREIAHAWELSRLAGGANKVQGPAKRYSGRVAHPVCHDEALRRERRGVAVEQESLI